MRLQLNPVWHTTSAKTKQLVADLRTLREMATFLIEYDAVSFYEYGRGRVLWC